MARGARLRVPPIVRIGARTGAAGARRRRAAACFVELAKPCGPSGRSNGTVAANPSQEVTAV
ncbi:hypothetical protein DIE14_17875 [Burkholderia sp. Bp9017]|nr:hypothetical protein DIE14_17875 [Burkholderia sp. Bp9017]RQZ33459.1 hypothetical protein DIE13_17785 [Burkholderia sp. Bp9016]